MKLVLLLSFAVVATESRTVATRRASTSAGRIIGGSPAAIEDFPSTVSVRYLGDHVCGAAILTSYQTLSAAHCVLGRAYTDFSTYYGSNDRLSGGTMATCNALLIHEAYDPTAPGYPNDIALVYALTEFDDLTAMPMNLPTGLTDFQGYLCSTAGWGRTDETNVLPTQLQELSLRVIGNSDCAGRLAGVQDAAIGDWHICMHDSSFEASGTCNGDSGNPLYCTEQQSGVTVVAGISSWSVASSGVCDTTLPSVFTRVSYFLGWLP